MLMLHPLFCRQWQCNFWPGKGGIALIHAQATYGSLLKGPRLKMKSQIARAFNVIITALCCNLDCAVWREGILYKGSARKLSDKLLLNFTIWADFYMRVNFYSIPEDLRTTLFKPRFFIDPFGLPLKHSAGMWCKVCWATDNWYKLAKQPLTVNDNARRIVPSRRLRTLTIFGRCWKNSRYVALGTGICPTYVRTYKGYVDSKRWRNLLDESKC